MKEIKIFDTTLRDGEQAPGCSMDISEKLEIARALDRMNVDVIEAGFAVISKGDFDSVKAVAEAVKNSTVGSLARSVKKDIDAAWEAVQVAKSPLIHVFLATSPLHMEYKLRMSPEKVLTTISESVAYAKSLCPRVEFSAEDAMRSEPEFLAKAVRTALKAGADVINIPDTVGYVTPWEMEERIRYLFANVDGLDKATVSIHCHDDLGLAVANSLAAIKAGATQVEGTFNGIGERAGNAALEEVIMTLNTRKEYFEATCRADTTQIYRTSRLIYSILGIPAPINKSIVGANAFAHEAGIHQHGVLAKKETYEIMTPESIGLQSNRMVLGKHSGKHAVEDRLIELGFNLDKEEIEVLFESFKRLTDKKKTVTDHDLEALVGHKKVEAPKGYKLDKFTVNSGNYVTCTAAISIRVGNEIFEEVAIGDGPVDAAFNAVDKIIKTPQHSLEDYAIHSVSEGNDAQGEAIVKLKSGSRIYTGRGLSTDILEASIIAYINAVNKLQDGS